LQITFRNMKASEPLGSFYGFSWIGCAADELCNRCGGQVRGMNFGIPGDCPETGRFWEHFSGGSGVILHLIFCP
jgi:hypothetical protein